MNAVMYLLIGFAFLCMIPISISLFKAMVFPTDYVSKDDFADWSLSWYETGEGYRGRHCK